MFAYDKSFDPEVVLGHCDLISRFSDFALYRLPSAPIFPIFSYIFRASYFFLYFDPKSYICPSNSYIFQNAADNNEIARKNHGILV